MNKVPDFAIFQDSKRFRSAIWTKELGEWQECDKEEFAAILIMANLIRHSPDPNATMGQLIQLMQFDSDGGGSKNKKR